MARRPPSGNRQTRPAAARKGPVKTQKTRPPRQVPMHRNHAKRGRR